MNSTLSPTISDTLELYRVFIRNAFLKMLAYRARYYTGIVTYLLFVSVYYFIWQAVYSNSTEPINGFSLDEMITYVAVGWIARSFYFSNIDTYIDDLVRTGQISIYLIRPVNFESMMIAQAVGESLFRFTLFSVPIGVVVLAIFPVNPPVSLAAFGLFFVSTLLGFLIMALINFSTGMLSFSLKSIHGVMRAKQNLLMLASGLLLPLTFFPDWIRWILELLPFQAIAYIPLQLYLGKLEGQQAAYALGLQCLWVVVTFLIGNFMWNRASKQLTLQGG